LTNNCILIIGHAKSKHCYDPFIVLGIYKVDIPYIRRLLSMASQENLKIPKG
jgi:hypothetical protein